MSPQKKTVPCPVCEQDAADVLYEPWVDVQDPVALYGAASGIQGTQRLVRCRTCGMIYETPRYSADVIIKGYEASQEAGHDSQYPMRVNSFFRALHRLRKQIPGSGARVLDIGTAGGAFLDAATQYGFDAHGMEPSQDLVARGKERGLQIEQGTIENHSFEAGTFDLVCLWDVLEHVPDPRDALQRIRPLLKPGGTLLVNYPDIGTWMARLAGKRFWWILSVHLHHFSRGTLTRLLETTGYQPGNFQRYWQTLQFGYLEDMAIHYRIPGSRLLKRLTPGFLQRVPMPYYASQTTAIAKVNP